MEIDARTGAPPPPMLCSQRRRDRCRAARAERRARKQSPPHRPGRHSRPSSLSSLTTSHHNPPRQAPINAPLSVHPNGLQDPEAAPAPVAAAVARPTGGQYHPDPTRAEEALRSAPPSARLYPPHQKLSSSLLQPPTTLFHHRRKGKGERTLRFKTVKPAAPCSSSQPTLSDGLPPLWFCSDLECGASQQEQS
ncbi:hypothetical protein PVAP13_6NG169203 [Panicum virgatum]|uniref:Uncharacterized protein n=1 Tax=Panicum virgatum TaxID=38727 RepID=A0A8T0QYX3_PANVG|nr:hypothetical protein PVAP13_6NG169203 [Panicum virgatum]